MSEWLAHNWEWLLLGFYTIEKIVKLTPTTKDDVIFDMVLKPVWDAVTKKK